MKTNRTTLILRLSELEALTKLPARTAVYSPPFDACLGRPLAHEGKEWIVVGIGYEHQPGKVLATLRAI